jgi:hypothetical protein
MRQRSIAHISLLAFIIMAFFYGIFQVVFLSRAQWLPSYTFHVCMISCICSLFVSLSLITFYALSLHKRTTVFPATPPIILILRVLTALMSLGIIAVFVVVRLNGSSPTLDIPITGHWVLIESVQSLFYIVPSILALELSLFFDLWFLLLAAIGSLPALLNALLWYSPLDPEFTTSTRNYFFLLACYALYLTAVALGTALRQVMKARQRA